MIKKIKRFWEIFNIIAGLAAWIIAGTLVVGVSGVFLSNNIVLTYTVITVVIGLIFVIEGFSKRR